MATEAKSASDLRSELVAETQKKVDESVNATRSGIGTRRKVGQTRGKNPQIIQFEVFDTSKPETLPTKLAEFATAAGLKDEAEFMPYLIDGYNSISYDNASDPIGEHVNQSWPEDIQKSFKATVRAFMSNLNLTLEAAVAAIKPQVEAAVAAKK